MVFRDVTREAAGAQGRRDGRILLVEDTRFYSIAIKERLERRLGANVFHAQTMAGMLRLIDNETEPFDLAVLDLYQSDGSNGEALDQLLARGVPCIVFTGISSDRRREEVLAKNVLDYVPKCSSSSIDALVAAVERFFSFADATLLVLDPLGAQSQVLPLLNGEAHPYIVAARESEAFRILDHSEGVQLILMNAQTDLSDYQRFIAGVKSRFAPDRVRIIGFNAKRTDGDVASFLSAGGDDFVHLPITSADLLGRVDHMLALHGHIQSLRRMASRDYLTDLLNRRYFYDRGPAMVEAGLRQGQPLAMALLDIDHFKRLNDTYGHEMGDVVLKAVAKRIIACVANTPHMAARIGGEEFGLLLIGLDNEQAYLYCERLREELGGVRVVVDEEEISITVSMGLAAIADNESFDNYLNAADQYLYLAKHSGRNRVFSDHQVAKMAVG